MCGRVTLTLDKEDVMAILKDIYEVTNTPEIITVPAYNIAPSEQVLSVIDSGVGKRAGTMSWGFVPYWAVEKDNYRSMINARSETVYTKPAFSQAFRQRRCIILADHFFEWKRGQVKRPYAFSIVDQPLMPLAGIYNTYVRTDGTKLNSCAVLTCEPNQVMAPVHNRMPVILEAKDIQRWLSKGSSLEILQPIMKPYPERYMRVYEVSAYVNSPRNKGEKTLEKAEIQG